MRTLGNILWFIFGGMFGGLAWILQDAFWCYYDCWNSVWTAVFQDGKAFVYAIWHECNWIKGVWKKIGLPVFFYAYHEAAIPLMQIET